MHSVSYSFSRFLEVNNCSFNKQKGLTRQRSKAPVPICCVNRNFRPLSACWRLVSEAKTFVTELETMQTAMVTK